MALVITEAYLAYKKVSAETGGEKAAPPVSDEYTPNPECQMCGGSGGYSYSRADHHPNCDGRCVHCPVEVQDYKPCECWRAASPELLPTQLDKEKE